MGDLALAAGPATSKGSTPICGTRLLRENAMAVTRAPSSGTRDRRTAHGSSEARRDITSFFASAYAGASGATAAIAAS